MAMQATTRTPVRILHSHNLYSSLSTNKPVHKFGLSPFVTEKTLSLFSKQKKRSHTHHTQIPAATIMNNSTTDSSSSKKVSFANKSIVYAPDKHLVLLEDDIQRIFYTNAEVDDILKECKRKGELPSFWYPLRTQRVFLLYDQVSTQQDYQRTQLTRIDWEAVANVCKKVTKYSQIRANQQGIKDAAEAQRGVQEAVAREEPDDEADGFKDSLIPKRTSIKLWSPLWRSVMI
jgi:hypothetical protein